ncbi:hypothetical protein Lalb_Chr25g0283721 [Lupinus albus]|uniref:Uncharacterized protein n=1 Tax=Lupinus albus TaxID=3870 RepID=A0A6A4ML37_LUPAL|nr:hypothetical protein Lalb_Chr25g0283721 [Lupinus albus]
MLKCHEDNGSNLTQDKQQQQDDPGKLTHDQENQVEHNQVVQMSMANGPTNQATNLQSLSLGHFIKHSL